MTNTAPGSDRTSDVHEVREPSGRESTVSPAANARELHALATYLLQKMEGDRFDLARRLHDELGGMITAAKMDMSFLSARIGPTLDEQSAEKFNSVLQMLNQAMTLKRRVVESLRPSLLDHFGLGVALRSHFEENCRIAGIECVATLPEDPVELDSPAQLMLFRVAQEVLDDALGRGGARHVELLVEREGEGYVMEIGDDGEAQERRLADAMPSVRHRVELAGGHIEAESRVGEGGHAGGNRIRVFVPRSTAGSA